MARTTLGVMVVRLQGSLDFAARGSVQPLLADVVSDSHGSVLIDLRRVRRVDGTGLALLIATGQQLRLQNRQLFLITEDPEFRALLGRTGVGSALAVYPSIDDAIWEATFRTEALASGWYAADCQRHAAGDMMGLDRPLSP